MSGVYYHLSMTVMMEAAYHVRSAAAGEVVFHLNSYHPLSLPNTIQTQIKIWKKGL